MNPFYQAMQPKQSMNFWQRFQQFRSEMQGKDPNAIIQEKMRSGEITQDQYNQARQQVQQIANSFQSMPEFSNKL